MKPSEWILVNASQRGPSTDGAVAGGLFAAVLAFLDFAHPDAAPPISPGPAGSGTRDLAESKPDAAPGDVPSTPQLESTVGLGEKVDAAPTAVSDIEILRKANRLALHAVGELTRERDEALAKVESLTLTNEDQRKWILNHKVEAEEEEWADQRLETRERELSESRAECDGLRDRVSELTADLAQAQETAHKLNAGALALREKLGAIEGECIIDFVERLAKERSETLVKIAELTAAESALTRQHTVEVERLTGERDRIRYDLEAVLFATRDKHDVDALLEETARISAACTTLDLELAASNRVRTTQAERIASLESELAASREHSRNLVQQNIGIGKDRDAARAEVTRLTSELDAMRSAKCDAEQSDWETRAELSAARSDVRRLTSELEAARGELERLKKSEQFGHAATVRRISDWLRDADHVALANRLLETEGSLFLRAATPEFDETPEPSGSSGEVRSIVVGSTWKNPLGSVSKVTRYSDGLVSAGGASYTENWWRAMMTHVSDPLDHPFDPCANCACSRYLHTSGRHPRNGNTCPCKVFASTPVVSKTETTAQPAQAWVPLKGTRVRVVEVASFDSEPRHKAGDVVTVYSFDASEYYLGWHILNDGTYCRVEPAEKAGARY